MQARGGWLSEACLGEEPSAEGTSSIRLGVEGGRVTTVSRKNVLQIRSRSIGRLVVVFMHFERTDFIYSARAGKDGTFSARRWTLAMACQVCLDVQNERSNSTDTVSRSDSIQDRQR